MKREGGASSPRRPIWSAVNLQLAIPRETFSEFDDVPDEVLLALIETELPRYLLRRLRSRLPLVAAGLVIWGLASYATGGSPTPAAAPSRPAAEAQTGTAPATATTATTATTGFTTPTAPFPGSAPAPTSGVVPTPTVGQGSATTLPPATTLVIVGSGYSSITGGTPFEQDPGNGALPVKSAAGQHLKRSFLRLSGASSTLHLELDKKFPSSGADVATVDACPISQHGWTADRGQRFNQGPSYKAADCVSGQRQPDGSWIFDLSQLDGGAAQPNGIALVPTAGSSETFDIAFSATALA